MGGWGKKYFSTCYLEVIPSNVVSYLPVFVIWVITLPISVVLLVPCLFQHQDWWFLIVLLPVSLVSLITLFQWCVGGNWCPRDVGRSSEDTASSCSWRSVWYQQWWMVFVVVGMLAYIHTQLWIYASRCTWHMHVCRHIIIYDICIHVSHQWHSSLFHKGRICVPHIYQNKKKEEKKKVMVMKWGSTQQVGKISSKYTMPKVR